MGDPEDTECLDNWEDLDDAGVLDKRIGKMQISQPLPNGISSSNSKLGTVIILNEDMRSRYVPPEPSVKILRRPATNGCDSIGNDSKPKLPIKTLQQREIEYAEARLRILGEAQSPEEIAVIEDRSDDSDSSGSRIQKIQSKTQILRPEESTCGVIRLPKGPDGTCGFNLKR